MLDKIKLLLILFFTFNFTNALAYNFSSDSEKLKSELTNNNINLANLKLAVIFIEPSQQAFKYKANLVDLKSQIIDELTKTFLIADPFVTADYVNHNSINKNSIENPTARNSIFNSLQNNGLLQVEFFAANNTNLKIAYSYYNLTEGGLFSFSENHSIEEVPADEKTAPTLNTNFSNPLKFINSDETLYDGSGPWGYFQPRASLNKEDNSFYFDSQILINNLSDVEFSYRSLRLDYRFKIIQLGVIENASKFGWRHSGYLHIKAAIVRPETFSIPLYIALGIKYRYFWNNTKNNDFYYPTDKDKSEHYKDLDQKSFYLNFEYFVSNLYFAFGGYIDNVNANLYSDLFLPYNFIFNIELNKYLIATTPKDSKLGKKYSDLNGSIGFKFQTTKDISLSLSYEHLSSTTILGIDYLLY